MKETWSKDEKSTRNCFHAKVHGDRVLCAKGHVITGAPDGGVSVKRALSGKSLWGGCGRCPDLDIKWD